jgi:2-polyprenyl-3-methyl-5-hydroxy-6-metoxy-1,4-benzoquinol methylase
MSLIDNIDGYKYSDRELSPAHTYLLPTVTKIVEQHFREYPGIWRMFDLGCGNGAVAVYFADRGCEVTGVDPSVEGIAQASATIPNIRLELGSAYDDLPGKYGRFPVVISLEVVEHVYAPRRFAATLFSLVEDSGVAIVSTPYHGYWKNVALAVSGSMDKHFTALWDHGHIKFWSITTLNSLLKEAGFTEITFHRVGRIHLLAKSMIAVARRR